MLTYSRTVAVLSIALAPLLACAQTHAQTDAAPQAQSDQQHSISNPLTLHQAQQRALQQQPQLLALSAQARAATARAVAAEQLPDPSLHLGLANLSLDRPDPWATDAERMTMTQIGVSQRFVRSDKRQLAASLERLQARHSALLARLQQREIAHAVGQAWVQAWTAEQLVALRQREVDLARLRETQRRIAVANADAAQAEQHQAQRLRMLAQAALQSARAQQQVARAQLQRWLGAVSQAPLAAPPTLPEPPELSALLAALPDLPQLQLAALQQQMQDTRLAQAEAERQPDWWLQTQYGYRRPYGDMITVGLGVDLPVFQARRQDQQATAALAELQAAQWRHEDLQRALTAQISSQHALLGEALERSRWLAQALAQARAAVASAEQRYGAGGLDLKDLLLQRDEALRTEIQWIEQQAQGLQRWLGLQALDAREVSS